MSRYNRLSRPVGLLCTRERYRHVCDVLELDPHNNDVVRHIYDPASACEGEICRLLELGSAQEVIRDYNAVKSLALARVRNEARATKFERREQE